MGVQMCSHEPQVLNFDPLAPGRVGCWGGATICQTKLSEVRQVLRDAVLTSVRLPRRRARFCTRNQSHPPPQT